MGRSTRAAAEGHSHPSPVLSISLGRGGHFTTGRDLVQNPDLTFLHQASFPSKNPICWGTLKKTARSNSGRMGIASQLAAWGVRLGRWQAQWHTHQQRKIQENVVIPKGPVETVGTKKTSLPSPGSNCYFEKNPHLKVRIRKRFLFRCIPRPKREKAGWHGVQRAALGGRALGSPRRTWDEPVATRAVPCGTWRQNAGTRARLGGPWPLP